MKDHLVDGTHKLPLGAFCRLQRQLTQGLLEG